MDAVHTVLVEFEVSMSSSLSQMERRERPCFEIGIHAMRAMNGSRDLIATSNREIKYWKTKLFVCKIEKIKWNKVQTCIMMPPSLNAWCECDHFNFYLVRLQNDLEWFIVNKLSVNNGNCASEIVGNIEKLSLCSIHILSIVHCTYIEMPQLNDNGIKFSILNSFFFILILYTYCARPGWCILYFHEIAHQYKPFVLLLSADDQTGMLCIVIHKFCWSLSGWKTKWKKYEKWIESRHKDDDYCSSERSASQGKNNNKK